MFSNLPKLADKNFIVGFLLPTLAATLVALFLCKDIRAFSWIYAAALNENSFGKLTILVLAVWLAATTLMICNHIMYQMLEGYIGPFNISRWRRKNRNAVSEAKQRLSAQRKDITDPAKPASAEQKAPYYKEMRKFLERFPPEERLVLPTRFGNVIRAFETYPLHVYGVDSIPAWLRMQAVIPKEYLSLVNDARALVDFFVNTFFLAMGITLLATLLCVSNLISIWYGYPSADGFRWTFPVVACIAAVLICIAYRGAVSQAIAWGNMVKSSFDLYLPALAKQLGYELPDNSADRHKFWDMNNRMFLYWEAIPPEAGQIMPSMMTEPNAVDSNVEEKSADGSGD